MFHFQAKYVFERRFTAKHLTMFGFFLTYSQSVRAKKKKKEKEKRRKKKKELVVLCCVVLRCVVVEPSQMRKPVLPAKI